MNGAAALTSVCHIDMIHCLPCNDIHAAAGPARVKVFYAGVRWGLSLQPSAVKSRQMLAKALNDAYVGEIRSVGQGECLTAVFLDANGSTAELGPVKWRGSTKANTSRWKMLAKTAARIYVRGPEASLP